MRNIVLIGSENTKRTDYFLKAADELKIPVLFEPLDQCVPENLKDCMIKIDPLVYKETEIDKMEELLKNYTKILKRFSSNKEISFLNDPAGILEVLDKVKCKEKLMENHIPTTKMIGFNISSIEELKQIMSEKKAASVFIKPAYGSGAAGVMAYSFMPRTGKQVLYTSGCLESGRFINTKTLHKLEEGGEIESLLNKVCSMPNIVEYWYPKAEFQGSKYDLRIVYQFGKMEFAVARQSRGPITNLHLNNQALSVSHLHLSEQKWEEIETLCLRAMKLFPSLSVAGIDIMLEKNSLKPLIIEINGQGDLLYQDIFHDNVIYKNQILYMYDYERPGEVWN